MNKKKIDAHVCLFSKSCKYGRCECSHKQIPNNSQEKYEKKLQDFQFICKINILTHCGLVTQICVFNTVKLGTSASSPYCHSTRGNVSGGITPSSTSRVFGEYFLKISVHKNSQRICYTFLKKHSINLINPQATNVIYIWSTYS